MEAMRKSWTDDRLDDFATNVDRRFNEVDRRFDEVDRRFDALEGRMERGFGKCEVEFHRINDRLDVLSKAIVFGAVSLTTGMLAGFAAMITLVATHT
jgi:tetrahydromethanopterin S-methyltransferase subunit G